MAGKIRVWGETSKTGGYLHSRLHSFTFLKYRSTVRKFLQATEAASKSAPLHWACGFKSHLLHQTPLFSASSALFRLSRSPCVSRRGSVLPPNCLLRGFLRASAHPRQGASLKI